MSDLVLTYALISILLGVSVLVKSLEVYSLGSNLEKGGALDWGVVGPEWLQRSNISWIFERIYSRSGMFYISAFSFLVLILLFYNLFVLKDEFFGRIIGIPLCLLHILNYYRQDLGTDGADQMSFIIAITVLLCFSFSTDEVIQIIGVAFISGQLIIAYLASGFSKLFSESWRTGKAAKGVLSTVTYGNGWTSSFIAKSRYVPLIICWSTIAWEILFPAIFFFDGYVFLFGLTVGVIFHLLVATVMGLNAFVWAFGAAYPAVYYLGTIY